MKLRRKQGQRDSVKLRRKQGQRDSVKLRIKQGQRDREKLGKQVESGINWGNWAERNGATGN